MRSRLSSLSGQPTPLQDKVAIVYRPRGISTEWVALGVLTVFVCTLSVLPLLRLSWAALLPSGIFDPDRIVEILAGKRVFAATMNSLKISLGATLMAMVLGVASALLVAVTDMKGKSAWVFGLVLPLMIPPQVTALAWIQAFSPSSPVLGYLGLSLPAGQRHPLYSEGGIIMLLGLYNVPLVFLVVRAGLRRLPGDLIEVARAAGAGPLRLLFTIVLPLVRSGIFAGAALAFVSSIGNFGIQAMLGIPARVPTLITLIYRKLNSYGTSALNDMALLALLLATITVVGLILAGWLGRWGDQRIDGSARPLRLPLGRWQTPVRIAAWGLLGATLLLPLSSLLASSLVSGYGQELNWQTLTLEHYRNAIFRHSAIRNAFGTSLWLTLTAVVVLSIVSVLLGYFLTWRKGLLARCLQMASELAYALPGLVIGVSMIVFFLKPLPLFNFSLYGTVWIILAAYLSNFLALALRPVLGGFAQLDQGLDEAARIVGAGFFTRFKDVILPMIAPAGMAGAIVVFMSAINEIQVSILLVTSTSQTIGPMIIFLEEAGSSTLAAAVGCLIVVLVLVLMAISSLFSHRLPNGVLPWSD